MIHLTNVWMLGLANGGNGIESIIIDFIDLAVAVAVVAGCWKTFEKAGRPGWGVLIPIYNVYLMIKIAGRPGWWLLLMLIPLVNVVILFLVSIEIAKAFGKSAAFGVGLMLLGMIFYPILGFGSAQYLGPRTVASPGM